MHDTESTTTLAAVEMTQRRRGPAIGVLRLLSVAY
jgi:hypothetical protein